MKIQNIQLSPIGVTKNNNSYAKQYVNLTSQPDTVSFSGIFKKECDKPKNYRKIIQKAASRFNMLSKDGKVHGSYGLETAEYVEKRAKYELEHSERLKKEAYENMNRGENDGVITYKNQGFVTKDYINQFGQPTSACFENGKLSNIHLASKDVDSYWFQDDTLTYVNKAMNPKGTAFKERFIFKNGELAQWSKNTKISKDETVKCDEVVFYEDNEPKGYISGYEQTSGSTKYKYVSRYRDKRLVEYDVNFEETALKNGSRKNTAEIIYYGKNGNASRYMKNSTDEPENGITISSCISLDDSGKPKGLAKYAENGRFINNQFAFDRIFKFTNNSSVSFIQEEF